MKLDWKHAAYMLAALPVVAIVFAWIGFFNIGASSGHWKITEWVLHGLMRGAVKTYSFDVDPPAELPREEVQPAAGHFARGCAVCHGAPGEPRSPTADRMLPQPPDLAGKVGEWSDGELFWIVKHGVRFTGMPAWPSQARDDEIWAMVAFLRELPAMDNLVYRDLAYGGQASPTLHPTDFAQSLAECARCHGADGLGRSPTTPILAGQSEAYLLESLRAYARKERASGFMQIPALVVDGENLPELAHHFAALPPPAQNEAVPEADIIRRGEAIARDGLPTQKVPACLGCHGAGERNPLYPKVAGQPAGYIAAQLNLFRDGTRGGTKFSHLMTNAAKGLRDEDIDALSAYFSTLRQAPATADR